MDLKASLKFANECPNLIKFYGALNAEVNNTKQGNNKAF